MKKNIGTLGAVASLLWLISPAANAYLIFFGEDLNNSSSTPLAVTPNSSAAEANFLSNLSGVGTEDFEAIAAGTGTPLPLVFAGAGTATLTGGNGSVVSVTPGATNGFGRYSISSATSSNFWSVAAGSSGNFNIGFTQSIAALGFYGIDIGDFGGQLQLKLSNDDILTVNNTVGSSTDGSVLYYGLIAETVAEQFTSIDFLMSAGRDDVFAFDKFTIGSREQITPPGSVPVPSTLALLGLGLLGLGSRRRRK